MRRQITGFHQDREGDWVADLSCLHHQHVRHRPPFQDRPWVTDEVERAARVKTHLECPLCDRAEMPDEIVLLRVAGPWDQDTVPPGLRGRHRTHEGTWGRLCVLEGSVGIQMETVPEIDTVLDAGSHQAIPPEVGHELRIIGPARICVEFWGRMPVDRTSS